MTVKMIPGGETLEVGDAYGMRLAEQGRAEILPEKAETATAEKAPGKAEAEEASEKAEKPARKGK